MGHRHGQPRRRAPLMDMEMIQYHPTTPCKQVLPDHRGSARRGRAPVRGVVASGSWDNLRTEQDGAPIPATSSRAPGRPRSMEGRRTLPDGTVGARHHGQSLESGSTRRFGRSCSWAETLAVGFHIINEPIPTSSLATSDVYGRCEDLNNLKGLPLSPASTPRAVSRAWSVHGGNRLGANSLLDTLIFGRRSGLARRRSLRSQSSSASPEGRARRCRAPGLGARRPRPGQGVAGSSQIRQGAGRDDGQGHVAASYRRGDPDRPGDGQAPPRGGQDRLHRRPRHRLQPGCAGRL